MNRPPRHLLALVRAFLLSALVAMTFSGCSLLGAALQLAGKAVNALAGNVADSSPMRLNMSVPIRAGEGAAVPTPTAAGPAAAESGVGQFPD